MIQTRTGEAVTLVRTPADGETGFWLARNAAAAEARGRLLFFVDAAVPPDGEWLRQASARLEQDPLLKLEWAPPPARSAFLIDAQVWRALEGYEALEHPDWNDWADADFDRRVRSLGYRVAARNAPAVVPLRPDDDAVESPYMAASGDEAFRKRWGHWRYDPAWAGPLTRRVDPESIAAYTAVAGGYDRLTRLPQERAADGVDFVAYLDAQSRRVNPDPACWQVREIEDEDVDACRTAKIYKVLSHRWFPDKEYSLWMDGNIILQCPLEIPRLVELHLRDADLCLFRHGARDCPYVEADHCKRLGLDAPHVIDAQMARYRCDGHPEHAGLAEASVILRRHTDRVREFNEAWWREIVSGSRRDQLSFNYVARSVGLRYAVFPISIRGQNGLFRRGAHLRPAPRLWRGPAR